MLQRALAGPDGAPCLATAKAKQGPRSHTALERETLRLPGSHTGACACKAGLPQSCAAGAPPRPVQPPPHAAPCLRGRPACRLQASPRPAGGPSSRFLTAWKSWRHIWSRQAALPLRCLLEGPCCQVAISLTHVAGPHGAAGTVDKHPSSNSWLHPGAWLHAGCCLRWLKACRSHTSCLSTAHTLTHLPLPLLSSCVPQDGWAEIDGLHPPASAGAGSAESTGAAPAGVGGSPCSWAWLQVVWSRGLTHQHLQASNVACRTAADSCRSLLLCCRASIQAVVLI